MLLVYSFIWRRWLEPQIWRSLYEEKPFIISCIWRKSSAPCKLSNLDMKEWEKKPLLSSVLQQVVKHEWTNLWSGPCASNCGLMPMLISPSKTKKNRTSLSCAPHSTWFPCTPLFLCEIWNGCHLFLWWFKCQCQLQGKQARSETARCCCEWR